LQKTKNPNTHNKEAKLYNLLNMTMK